MNERLLPGVLDAAVWHGELVAGCLLGSRNTGIGVWGEDYMPPQPQVSDANAKTMAELILALKP
jgi:cytochrome c